MTDEENKEHDAQASENEITNDEGTQEEGTEAEGTQAEGTEDESTEAEETREETREEATTKKIVGDNDLPTDEFATALEDETFLEELARLEINADEIIQEQIGLRMLLRNRFLYIYIYNKDVPIDNLPGKYLRQFNTKSGFLVYVMQHCLILTPGEKAFETYGNWGRSISSIQEILDDQEMLREWGNIGLWASDTTIEANAWAEATLRGLKVSEDAPSEEAAEKMKLLRGVYGDKTPQIQKRPAGPSKSKA